MDRRVRRPRDYYAKSFLCFSHAKLHHNAEAIRYCEAALSASQDEMQKGALLQQLGTLSLEQHNQKAKEYFEQATKIFEAQHDYVRVAHSAWGQALAEEALSQNPTEVFPRFRTTSTR